MSKPMKEDNISTAVVKVIKEKEKACKRYSGKNKCVVAFGIMQRKMLLKYDKEKKERQVVEDIVKEMQDNANKCEEEIDEIGLESIPKEAKGQSKKASGHKQQLRKEMEISK